MQHYIVRMRDSSIHLVGPFANIIDLTRWGNDPENNPGDDPRWQSIMLSDDDVAMPLDVIKPKENNMLRIQQVINATDAFATISGWVEPPPPPDDMSEKAIQLGELISEGSFGCRAEPIRKIVSLIIGEDLPPIANNIQTWTSLNVSGVADGTILTTTSEYGGIPKGTVLMVDSQTSRHYSSEILRALLQNGERSPYIDFSYLRPATLDEMESYVEEYNRRTDNGRT